MRGLVQRGRFVAKGIDMKIGFPLASLFLYLVSIDAVSLGSDSSELRKPDSPTESIVAQKSVRLCNVVAELNEVSKHHNLGKSQEPITTDEVVGAIHRWLDSNNKRPTAGIGFHDSTICPDDKRLKFLQIAETQMLNAGDELRFATGLNSNGYVYTVWWIDLTVDKFRIRLRDRTLGCRKQTDENHVDSNSPSK